MLSYCNYVSKQINSYYFLLSLGPFYFTFKALQNVKENVTEKVYKRPFREVIVFG